jgi:hypothetical protein
MAATVNLHRLAHQHTQDESVPFLVDGVWQSHPSDLGFSGWNFDPQVRSSKRRYSHRWHAASREVRRPRADHILDDLCRDDRRRLNLDERPELPQRLLLDRRSALQQLRPDDGMGRIRGVAALRDRPDRARAG